MPVKIEANNIIFVRALSYGDCENGSEKTTPYASLN
jgi:hypothetical protein